MSNRRAFRASSWAEVEGRDRNQELARPPFQHSDSFACAPDLDKAEDVRCLSILPDIHRHGILHPLLARRAGHATIYRVGGIAKSAHPGLRSEYRAECSL